MTLLPNGQTASYREDSEASAKKELRRLTEAYLARVRALYPDLGLAFPAGALPAAVTAIPFWRSEVATLQRCAADRTRLWYPDPRYGSGWKSVTGHSEIVAI
jgi:hypothetical protein